MIAVVDVTDSRYADACTELAQLGELASVLLTDFEMGEANAEGAMVGRYLLHREIAKGGMARIHIARSIGSHGFTRLVAAKRLEPGFAQDEELVEMFLDEARLASKIRHRNVVPVLDVVSIGGEIIMVQELVHGVALHKLCRRAQDAGTRIPIEIAVAIATQVLAGLHAAHEAADETGELLCIVHRDVSPQNVMIATDGTARLLDFGVAKASRAAQSHVTRTGTFKGKVSYSSPEHLLGAATRQSDIYSLAVVLWELIVGERMHAGRDREVFVTILEGTPPSLTEALAAQHAAFKFDDRTWSQIMALEPILRRALTRDLSERFATAAEMESALHAAVTPAPLADVAAWLKSLAQDLLEATAQMIAAEERSWRKWGANAAAIRLADGSGVVPTVSLGESPEPPRRYPRRSTSLETKAIKPRACAKLLLRGRPADPDASESTARIRRGPLVDAIAIASVLALLVVAVMLANAPVSSAALRAYEPPTFDVPSVAAVESPATVVLFTDEPALTAETQPEPSKTEPRPTTKRANKPARKPARKQPCRMSKRGC